LPQEAFGPALWQWQPWSAQQEESRDCRAAPTQANLLATQPSFSSADGVPGVDFEWPSWSAADPTQVSHLYGQGAIEADALHHSYAHMVEDMMLGESDTNSEWSDGLTSLPEEPNDIHIVNSSYSWACASLCEDAAKADVVALDAEWNPDYEPGSNNEISVLQLAFPHSCRVYVVQLKRLGGKLPAAVQMMLVNPEVTKVGFGVHGSDLAKLALTGIKVTPSSILDVQDACSAALGCPSGTAGLQYAANALLGFSLDKDKRLVCSNWSSFDLTPEQIRYAALDAWVTLRLHYNFGIW